MGRKNRAYKKGEPFRDCRKFIIIAEGEREDNYFMQFNSLSSRVEIIIIDRDGGKSSVKYFLERVNVYSKKHDLLQDDFVWFVLDVDRWPRSDINNLGMACQNVANWKMAISNPCFEVWLYYHFKEEIPIKLSKPKEFKTAISKLNHGGYNPIVFAKEIRVAQKNAKKKDTHKGQNYPDIHQTKVYKLAQELLVLLGNDW